MSKIVKFGRECIGELRKVVWPSRANVWSAVKVVIVSTLLIAAFLGGLDLLFVAGLDSIF